MTEFSVHGCGQGGVCQVESTAVAIISKLNVSMEGAQPIMNHVNLSWLLQGKEVGLVDLPLGAAAVEFADGLAVSRI